MTNFIPKKSFILLLIILNFILCQYALAETKQTDVPVKRVILFGSGVGYFEHSGNLRGMGSTELSKSG